MSYALDLRRTRRVRPHSLHGLGCGCAMPVSGLGELVTPDRWIWMPGDIRAWLNQINEQIRALDNDIEAHRSTLMAASGGPRFVSDFNTFQARWLRFNADAASWWGNTVAAAQEYVNEYNALEQRFRAITGVSPTRSHALSTEESPSALRAANRNLMIWSVIGIAGVVGAGYLLSNYARIKTLSKLTLNRRRRRRSRR